MPQGIVLPLDRLLRLDAPFVVGFNRRRKCNLLLPLVKQNGLTRPNLALSPGVGSQPLSQVISNGDNSAAGGLGPARAYHDHAPGKVNVLPFEPLNLGTPQTSKRTDGQTRQKTGVVGASGFQQPGNFNRLEYLNITVADLELFNALNRIIGGGAPGNGKLKEGMQDRAIIAVALGAQLEAVQPVLHVGGSDVATVFAAIPGKPLRNRVEMGMDENGFRDWTITDKYPLVNARGKVVGLIGTIQFLEARRKMLGYLGPVGKAVDFIRDRLGDGLMLSEIARHAGLSERQLQRLFRRACGMTIQQFIIRSRIQAAIQELTHSQRTIAEIALMFGFSDQSAFTNQFRSVVGLPPRIYRERYLAELTASRE